MPERSDVPPALLTLLERMTSELEQHMARKS